MDMLSITTWWLLSNDRYSNNKDQTDSYNLGLPLCKMKKFIVAILAILYLNTSIGATIHLHYCMDKLVAWDLGNKEDNIVCPYCGMAKTATTDQHCGSDSKGCCKDEQKHVKIEKDQKATENNFDFSKVLFQPITISYSDNNVNYNATYLEYPISNSPPGTRNIPLFVRNCVFRIWDFLLQLLWSNIRWITMLPDIFSSVIFHPYNNS